MGLKDHNGYNHYSHYMEILTVGPLITVQYMCKKQPLYCQREVGIENTYDFMGLQVLFLSQKQKLDS